MIVDTHTHLDSYGKNIQRAVDEIIQNKIVTLDTAMNPDSYLKSKTISEKCKYVIPCFGIHPFEAYKYYSAIESFDNYIKEAVVIGEIGLDFYWYENKAHYDIQRKVFEYLIQKASQQNKIVNLHTKGAELEILEKIKEYQLVNPIIHWYSGPEKLIKKFLDAGAYFTVSVELSFSRKIQSVLKRIPNDRLLLESDNISGFEWLTGKIAYPSIIMSVADKTAELKNIKKDLVIEITNSNFEKIFSESREILAILKSLKEN